MRQLNQRALWPALAIALSAALAPSISTAATQPAGDDGTGNSSSSGDALADAWTLRDAKDFNAALGRVQDGLAAKPNDPDLYRLRVLVLTDLGASYRAWELYAARPDLFDTEQREMIEADRLARLVTWSRLYPESERGHQDEARLAEREIKRYLAGAPDLAAATRLRLRYDHLLLDNQLGNHRKVADDEQRLREEGTPVPGYSEAVVGDSLLTLRRPEAAEAAFQRALNANPNDVQSRILLSYAQLEQERFDQALPAMDALRAQQPEWVHMEGARYSAPNWFRYDADTNAAAMVSFGEYLADAQQRLESLARVGPDVADLQSDLGAIYARRGWNERALERFRIAGNLDERSVPARLGQVGTLVALDRGDQARPIRDDLLAVYPDALHVQQMDEAWRRHYGWQLRAYVGAGRNRGDTGATQSPFGERDREYGLEVATPLLDDRWRLTAARRERWADFGPARLRDRRTAVGVSYAHDRLALAAEVNRSQEGDRRTGAAIDATWRFNDVFSGYAGLRRNDFQAPLRARDAGIDADSALVGIDYHPNELTRVAAEAQRWRFDDGNRRTALLASVDQRLLTRPHFLLNGIVTGSASRNSRDDAPYFNPSSDASLQFAVRADHLAWRRYEHHLRQRLTVGAGPYHQEGFGADWVPQARYEHQWQFGVGRVLTYGVSWSRPVYDGRREERLGVDAEFRWGD